MTSDSSISLPVLDVAFIVYNYTSKLLLKKQLDFFSKSDLSFSYSLTVVDDASLDGSRELVQAYQGVGCVFLDNCLGVGRAFNRGLAAAPESRYACLLHTDVNLTAEALESLFHHCDQHPEVKVCSPVICFPMGGIQNFVFNPSLLALYFRSVEKKQSKSAGRRVRSALKPVRVPGIIGPFLFCSRKLVADCLLYDESFQQYYCDMELAHRLMQQGIACEVLPHCSLVRLGGQTSFVRDLEMYFSMKHEYVKKFYGQRQAQQVLSFDLFAARLKMFSYSLIYKVAPSSKLTFQIERYRNRVCTLEKIQKSILTA
jgi:GT2 family glycosyltransferase